MKEYIKILGSGHNTTLIISNDEMEDILKIVKYLEDSGILSSTCGSISIASFATVIGTPAGIASPSLAFSLSTGLVKKS